MTQQAISPLRQRMIDDMAIRKFAPKTQHDYVQRVKDFAVFLGRSPDAAKSDDVRSFRLHLSSMPFIAHPRAELRPARRKGWISHPHVCRQKIDERRRLSLNGGWP